MKKLRCLSCHVLCMSPSEPFDNTRHHTLHHEMEKLFLFLQYRWTIFRWHLQTIFCLKLFDHLPCLYGTLFSCPGLTVSKQKQHGSACLPSERSMHIEQLKHLKCVENV